MSFRIPDTISEVELGKLVDACSQNNHKLAFALGFYQGMRVSEVVKLKPEDVDKGTRLIHIRQAKGGKDRMIPISPSVLKGLKYLPVGCGVRALQMKFKELSKQVLGKDLHFHCLRHSGASYYINVKHWSSLEVQRLLGHSRVQTTEIYTHINPENLVNRMWEQ